MASKLKVDEITNLNENGFITISGNTGLNLSSSTSAIALPRGTTAQRPESAPSGAMRFNTQTLSLEIYDGTAWAVGSSGSIVLNGLVLNLDAGNLASYPGLASTGYNTWFDLSGNQNNGILANGVKSSGGSLVFDGSDDYVNCGNQSSLNLTNGISVSVWVKFTSTINNSRQMMVEKHTSPGSGWWFAGQNNKIIWIVVGTSGGEKYIDLTNNTSLISGTIYNIVGTYNVTGSDLKLYVNGSNDGGTILGGGSGLSSSANPLIIGKQHNWGNSPSSLTIFNTSIYNRALTAAEVSQNYNALKGRFGL